MDAAEAVILKAVEQHKGTKELIDRGDSSVQQFYRDAVVFVTGGSGFLGKQLIEKLFRTCKLRKVFILMRSKKRMSIDKRLAAILSDPLFDLLRADQPDFVGKLVPVEGELSEKDLAISNKDQEMLIKEVDVIFHVAATISFLEPLRSATLTNVRGTRDLLCLAKKCKKIRSFVYMSTAYSHGTVSRHGTELEEVFYNTPVDPHLMIQLAETVDEQMLNDIKDGLIKDWPNTYSFTKALAEELIHNSAGDLPVSIIRPSVVVCAKREPYAGWIDLSSVFGPSGITLGCMMGVIHSLQSVQDVRIDFIPVDYVNNTAIVAAASTRRGIRIYHVASSCRNHLTWGGLTHILNNIARRTIVSPKALWYCFVVQSPYGWVHRLFSFLLHTVPANLVDGICVMLNKPPRLKKIYVTVTKMAMTIGFYANNSWTFNDNNTVDLYNSLSVEDKVLYHCDAADLVWAEMIVLWCVGLRKYIVKDGLRDTELGMRKQLYFRVATYFISGLFIYVVLLLLCYLCKFVM